MRQRTLWAADQLRRPRALLVVLPLVAFVRSGCCGMRRAPSNTRDARQQQRRHCITAPPVRAAQASWCLTTSLVQHPPSRHSRGLHNPATTHTPAAPAADDVVPAWYDPTGRVWRRPAPGDPSFRAHMDSLRLVPRTLVVAETTTTTAAAVSSAPRVA